MLIKPPFKQLRWGHSHSIPVKARVLAARPLHGTAAPPGTELPEPSWPLLWPPAFLCPEQPRIRAVEALARGAGAGESHSASRPGCSALRVTLS